MINTQLLLSKLEDNNLQGIIGKVLESPLQSGTSKIEYNPAYNCLELYGVDNKVLVDDIPNYILGFTPELLDKQFNSILIGGLGLGIIPFVVQDFCTTVDIIEINTDIINVNQQLNVLDSKINIIEGDIFNFQPTKTYDVIVLDIWYSNISEEIVETLNSIYLPFLNEGGFLYYPINVTSKENTTVIVNK